MAIVWTLNARSASRPSARRERDQVQVLERAQRAEIEHRAEVDVETVEPLAGEEPDAAVERRRSPRRRGRRSSASSADRCCTAAAAVLAEHGACAAAHLGDGGELAAVPVVAVELFDRAGVVEEAVLAHLGGELEQVGHVGLAVAVVVDVDAVQHVVAELVEVRAAGGILERDVVGDQRDRPGFVGMGADEGVGVGAVGHRVLGDLWRFTV